jgi:hypothetical protein
MVMDPLDLDAAFSAAGALAMAGWAGLILLPRWRGLSVRLAGLVIPAVLSLGYAVLILMHWQGASGGFGSLDQVAALFGSRPLLLAGWVHYLAFDLLVGAWVLRRSQEQAIAHGLIVPVLLLTFLFGPLGYLAYLWLEASVRSAREDRIARLQARLPAWLRALEIEPRLAAAAFAMLLLALPLALAWALDPRLFQGVSTWIKPLKFALSAALFLQTLALFVPLAGERFRASLAGRYLIWPVIVPLIGEVLYIAWRASRVEASHYNTDSALGAALYSLMAVGAVMFTAAPGVLAYGLARGDAVAMPGVLRWSLVGGLALTAVLGIVSGFAMGGSPSGHYVGAVPPDHATVPFLGWSLEIGDLRLPHFLGLHALQFVPLFGLLVWRLTSEVRHGLLAVAAFTTIYAAVTLTALAAALGGRPLLGWA